MKVTYQLSYLVKTKCSFDHLFQKSVIVAHKTLHTETLRIVFFTGAPNFIFVLRYDKLFDHVSSFEVHVKLIDIPKSCT